MVTRKIEPRSVTRQAARTGNVVCMPESICHLTGLGKGGSWGWTSVLYRHILSGVSKKDQAASSAGRALNARRNAVLSPAARSFIARRAGLARMAGLSRAERVALARLGAKARWGR